MRRRWPEWVLALLLTGLAVLLLLRPAGPRPGDLHLEVVRVRDLPPQEGRPRTVEVKVRWHWLRPPAEGALVRGRHLLALSIDPGRWVVHGPSTRVEPPKLLNLLGQPTSFWAVTVVPGRDESLSLVLAAREAGSFYRAPVIPLSVHYVHEAGARFSAPNWTWVKTVSGVYPLEPEP